MKKLAVALLFLLIAFSGYYMLSFFRSVKKDNILSSQVKITPTPTPLRLPNGIITEKGFENNQFIIFTVKIPDQAETTLIPNFSERLTGEKIVTENNCDLSINGGFYQGNGTPLGLFISKEKVMGKEVKSSIANAFIWQENSGKIEMGLDYPTNLESVNFIFQTGPYITVQNKKLQLTNDGRARRSFMAKDDKGGTYIISMTNKTNLVSGPKLADVPIIFNQLIDDNILPFTELVNLDGGSASFFFSRDRYGNLTLPSWAPVGSVLCVRWNEGK